MGIGNGEVLVKGYNLLVIKWLSSGDQMYSMLDMLTNLIVVFLQYVCASNRYITSPLARGLSWLEHHPIYRKAENMIHSQSTYLDCGFSPQSRYIWGATNQCFSLTPMSFSLFFYLYLSLCTPFFSI